MIMRPYIEDIVNVRGDDNCGFRVIDRHLGMDEDSHVFVRHALINELKNQKSDHLPIYGPRGVLNLSGMVSTLQQVEVVLRRLISG